MVKSQRKRTNVAETLVNLESLEQFHAATIGDVHLGPSCGVQIALNQHTSCAVLGELQGCDQARGPSSNNEHWCFVFNDLSRSRQLRKAGPSRWQWQCEWPRPF
jgi:hypothetical protein